VFTTPVRWTLRVLAWIAFAVSAYLAWHSITQTHVAGCGVGGDSGCDMVLSSSWSKWIFLPVALPGLACYATLATLSVLLGRLSAPANRWVDAAFVMLATVAALGSLWFLALQVFAIGHFCTFCIITDLCGIAIGALAVGSLVLWLQGTRHLRSSRNAAGVMALRSALPAAPRTTPVPGMRTVPVPGSRPATATNSRVQPAPPLGLVFGGAAAIIVLLIGGQLIFPAKGYELQQVALTEKIDLNGDSDEADEEPQPQHGNERVALRIPTETDADEVAKDPTDAEKAPDDRKDADPNEPDASAAPNVEKSNNGNGTIASEPRRKRIVKFLDGKLALDVYKHPLIGSPEAPHVMVEMVSYDCKHCRSTHRVVKQALQRYGNQVAIILMVIPLEKECNKLITNPIGSHRGACSTARMALSVATIKPSAFPKFHDWLMADKEKPPILSSIVGRAYSLVDSQRLRDTSSSEQIKKQIAGYVNLFGTLQKQHTGAKQFGLPVQILGDHVMTGSVEKNSDLFKAWEENLGVKPR
jgi:uncharacterized membrane protein